jgi:hypothetical protein
MISRSGCADLSIFPTSPDDAIVVVEEESMIDGLKLTITGEELILALNERIERCGSGPTRTVRRCRVN